MNNSSNNNDKNCTMINNRGSLLPESTKSSHSQNQKYNNDQESGLNNDGREQERYAPKPASGTETGVRNNLENERTPLISRQDDRNYMKYGNSTVKQTVFNAVNILMGIAILSLPFAFKYAGWFFGISIFLFCLIQTNYTAKTLKKCLDADPECLTYIDIANLAFGNKGKLFIGALFMLDLFNAAVACMILVGDSLKSLFPNVELVTLKLIVFFIVTPITWMPINLLSHVSIIGIVAASSLAAVIIFDGFAKYESPGSLLNPMDTYLFPPNWMALPLAFGLINAGFAGHAVFPSLYRDMAKPGSYNKMVNYSYFITGAVYITVAVSGYLMFGSETMEEITLNIMSTPGFSILLNSIVVWLIVINPFCKYPLILVPINLCIEIGFFRMVVLRSKAWKRFYFIFSRTLMSLIIVSVAIFLPEFDRAMSLLGSFFSFLISGIFPLLCYLKIFGRQLSNKEIAWNLFLLVTSSIMAITGTIWTFFPRDWIENTEENITHL